MNYRNKYKELFVKNIIKESLSDFSDLQINLKSESSLDAISDHIAKSIFKNEKQVPGLFSTESRFLDKWEDKKKETILLKTEGLF